MLSDGIIEPVAGRILFRKDDERGSTRGGIILPETTKIPVLTGRVLSIAKDLENDFEFPITKGDKVLIDPTEAIPVDFEQGNKLYIVPSEDVIAVIRKSECDSSGDMRPLK